MSSPVKGNKRPRKGDGTEQVRREKLYVITFTNRELFVPENGKSSVLYSQANNSCLDQFTSIVPSWNLPPELAETVRKLKIGRRDRESIVYANDQTAGEILDLLSSAEEYDSDSDHNDDDDEIKREYRELSEDIRNLVDWLLEDTNIDFDDLWDKKDEGEELIKCVDDALHERIQLSDAVEHMLDHATTVLSAEALHGGIEILFVKVSKNETVGTD